MTDSPHLKHGDIRAVWCGGQVAATGHRLVGRLHIQLAPQDAFVIEFLPTHIVQRGRVSVEYIIFYR